MFFSISGPMFSQQPLVEAQAYFNDKKYDLVIVTLEAESLLPIEHSDVIELLGDAYSHTEKWDAAISQYRVLINAHTDVANYYYKYGGALAMKALNGSKMQAIPLVLDAKEAFLTAATLDAKHIDTRWALVKIYIELPWVLGGSTTTAIMYANELEALSVVDGCLAKGYIYEKNHDYKLAEQHYKKAVEVGQSKVCYNTLATFYLNQNQTHKSITVLRAAFTKFKDDDFQQKIAEISQ